MIEEKDVNVDIEEVNSGFNVGRRKRRRKKRGIGYERIRERFERGEDND